MRKHRLAKFIATSLLAFLGMVIIVACTDGSRKVVKAFPKKDSVVLQKQTDLPQRVFRGLETVVDTVYDDWHVLIQTICPTKVFSHHLRNIEVASEFMDSGDSTKIRSKVYFYLHDTYTPFDSVYVEMKRDDEVNYGCVIDKVIP